MEKLILLEKLEVNNLLNTRDGEIKFGEQIKLLSNVSNIYDAIKSLDVDYVIFGLPEDVGVFANQGNTGTYNAWNATIKVLLNIQSNPFTAANRVLILGHLDFTEELEQLSKLKQNDKKHIQSARKLVTEIDKHVTDLVCTIISAGKTPIAIGGGHNNAYGIIKGTSLGLKKPINAINFDAHTDFRNLEGRHSGNGFSYAYNEGFLKKYFICCTFVLSKVVASCIFSTFKRSFSVNKISISSCNARYFCLYLHKLFTLVSAVCKESIRPCILSLASTKF